MKIVTWWPYLTNHRQAFSFINIQPYNTWKPFKIQWWLLWLIQNFIIIPKESCKKLVQMALREDEAAAAQSLTSSHDANMNRDALPNVEVDGEIHVDRKKEVTLLGGITVIVSLTIASGIFIAPKGVLTQTESVGMCLVIWAGCSILALLGSLCYNEMGAMIPKSGAEYSYIYKAFGPLLGLFYSWMIALIIRPYSLSVVSLTFVHYVSQSFFPDSEISPIPVRKILAATCLGEYP